MLYFQNILNFILILPLTGAIIMIVLPFKNKNLLKIFTLNISFVILALTITLWILFQKNLPGFQFVGNNNWFAIFNLHFLLGIDGISLFFVLLTALLIPLTLLVNWNNNSYFLKQYLIAFLLLEFFLVGVFCVLDLLLFYIFFESILIPMFLIIGQWGSRSRKIRAALFFFIYTLLGSVLMLLAVIYIYYQIGALSYEIIISFSFSFFEQQVLWFAFFASFATKVPMVPMHLWLPEAHVEAPTAGSVILAGVLLKLGTYGFIRFSLPFFSKSSFYFTPLVYTLSIIGVIYTSFTAIRQTDFKKIVAYSSIAHMNLVIMGIFSFNLPGLEGAILQSISHGFVASALFLIIGIIYERSSTRIIKYYGGLVHLMPVYIVMFLFFTLANIGLPGTSSFIGEFLLLLGIFKVNTTACFLGATGMVLGACYSLWLFNRVAYGNLKFEYCVHFLDLNKREFLVFLPLIIGTLLVGILPNIILESVHISLNFLIELIYF